ncbi:hypothetical protein HYH03_016081 [Edaphochlamys debaryana]|uniref:Uncharacterized protein n=1 Tax=Edaphochlamys debaryana TaxID=47281 RepID=A0A835XI96_9CHLO|nr:hypothetical protein HYH03_016081 [Edaphochlamys debaryana]|eukprot:KAG2485192.1 hypothetical protein HYH03_016081 [Edaphochlamys debaryana]
MLDQLIEVAAGDARVSAALERREAYDALVSAVERALLHRDPELFAGAVAQLTATDVEGCCPDPRRAEAARLRGNALFGSGRWREAAEAYTEALQYQPALTPAGRAAAARLFSNRSAALLRLAPRPDARGALADAREAAAADPTFRKAHYRSACARRLLGDLEGALGDCRRAGGDGGGAGGGGGVDEVSYLLAELELELGRGGRGQGQEGGQGQGSQGAGGSVVGAEAGAGAEAGEGRTGYDQVLLAEAQSAAEGRHLLAAPSGPPLPPAADVLWDWPLAAVTARRWRRRPPPGRGGGGGGAAAPSPFWSGLRCWRCTRPLGRLAPGEEVEGKDEGEGAAGTGGGGAAQHGSAGGVRPSVPYPCQYCPMALYCSPQCRDADPYHVPGGAECGLPWASLLPEEGLLAARLLRAAGAEEAAEAGGARGGMEPAGPGPGVGAGAGAAGLPAAGSGGGSAAPGAAGAGGVRGVLGRLVSHSLPDPLGGAVLAAAAAAAYRAACAAALRRWLAEKLEPPPPPLLPPIPAPAAPPPKLAHTNPSSSYSSSYSTAPSSSLQPPSTPTPPHQEQQQQQQPQQHHQQDHQEQHQHLQEEEQLQRRQRRRWLTGAVPVGGALVPPELSSAGLMRVLGVVAANGAALRGPPGAGAGVAGRLGLALCPLLAAWVNHSCCPSAQLRFHGLQAVLRTGRPLPPGAPLAISYGPQEGKSSRAARRAALQAQYGFLCRCEACSDDRRCAVLEAALWGLACPACGPAQHAPHAAPHAAQGMAVTATAACAPRLGALPAAVRPSNPALTAVLLGAEAEEAALAEADALEAAAAAAGSSGGGGACSRCRRALSPAQQAAAAAALARAGSMLEAGREGLAAAAGASGGGGAAAAAAAAARGLRLLCGAAREQAAVLPCTSRLLGATRHEAGEAALGRLQALQALQGQQGLQGPAPQGAPHRELEAAAAEAAAGLAENLAALELVYGACSTEVLYEAELLGRLLGALAGHRGVGREQGGDPHGAARRGDEGTGDGPPGGAAAAEGPCCACCGAEAAQHEGRMGAALAELRRGVLGAAVCGGGSGGGGDGGGGEGTPRWARLQGAAAALGACIAWHVNGEPAHG